MVLGALEGVGCSRECWKTCRVGFELRKLVQDDAHSNRKQVPSSSSSLVVSFQSQPTGSKREKQKCVLQSPSPGLTKRSREGGLGAKRPQLSSWQGKLHLSFWIVVLP